MLWMDPGLEGSGQEFIAVLGSPTAFERLGGVENLGLARIPPTYWNVFAL